MFGCQVWISANSTKLQGGGEEVKNAQGGSTFAPQVKYEFKKKKKKTGTVPRNAFAYDIGLELILCLSYTWSSLEQ